MSNYSLKPLPGLVKPGQRLYLEFLSPEGRPFFFDAERQVSQWERPSEQQAVVYNGQKYQEQAYLAMHEGSFEAHVKELAYLREQQQAYMQQPPPVPLSPISAAGIQYVSGLPSDMDIEAGAGGREPVHLPPAQRVE